jgi:integrase
MLKLTQTSVGTALRRNASGNMKPSTKRDTDIAGLRLKVGMRRARWVFSYRPHGRAEHKRLASRDMTLGDAMLVSLGEARRLALLAKAAVANGDDPHVETMRDRRAKAFGRAVKPVTVGEAWGAYGKTLLGRLEGTKSHRKAEVSYVRKAIILLGADAWRMNDLTVGSIREMLTRLPNRSSETRHVFGALSRFCDWLLANELIPVNPCERISRRERPKTPPSRARAPDIGELALVWQAAEQEGMRALVRMMLLVPARRGELAQMHWRDIDLERRVWSQPAAITKNRLAHKFPLSEPAVNLLRGRGRELGWVFPAPLSGGVFMGWGRLVERLRKNSGVDFTLHDFRRSFVSGLAHRFDETRLDLTLNHAASSTRGGVKGVYQRATHWPERVAMMDAWADMLMHAVAGGADVIQLREIEVG